MSAKDSGSRKKQDRNYGNSNRSLSEERAAAQVRVYADRRNKRKTPQWIVDLAGDDVPYKPSWWERLRGY
jgi:hypothetical protein